MVREKRIKRILLTLLVFLVGFTKVSAASYTGFDYSAQFYDNVNGNLTAVTTGGPAAATGLYEGYIAYTANSSGGAWGISSPTTLLANHTYTLTVSIPNECGKLVLSTYNRIGVGTTMNNAKTSYQNNSNVNEVYSKVIGGDNFLIQFAFTPTINGSFIVFPFSTDTSCGSSRTILESISIDDLGKDSVTEEQITNSLNVQTNEINTTINNLGTDIKDSIKDEFNTCRDSVNILNVTTNNKDITCQYCGLVFGTYTIEQGQVYTLSFNTNSNGGKVYIHENSGFSWGEISTNGGRVSMTLTALQSGTFTTALVIASGANVTTPYNLTEIQLEKGNYGTPYEEYGKQICQNKIDETNDKLDQTNQQLGDLNNSLTDSSPTDMSGLGDSAGWLPAGPVDSILTLPLTMLNSLVSNLSNNSCQTISVELPFVNENITLPCVRSLYDKMGVTGTLFTTAGLIASAFILFNYLLALYKWVDDTLTMRENTMPGYFDDNWGGGA